MGDFGISYLTTFMVMVIIIILMTRAKTKFEGENVVYKSSLCPLDGEDKRNARNQFLIFSLGTHFGHIYTFHCFSSSYTFFYTTILSTKCRYYKTNNSIIN